MNRTIKIDNNTRIVFNDKDLTADIYSYNSHIINIEYPTVNNKLDKIKITLFKNWNYSPTTSRGRNKALEYLGYKELATTETLLKYVNGQE